MQFSNYTAGTVRRTTVKTCPGFRTTRLLAPIIDSPEEVEGFVNSELIYEITLSQGSNFEGCTVIYSLSPQSWFACDPLSGRCSGTPTGEGEATFEALAYNCVGSDKKQIKIKVSEAKVKTARWGRSTKTILTDLEVPTLAHRDGRLDIEDGHMPMDAGLNTEFLYVFVADSIGDPGERLDGKGFYVNGTGTQAAMASGSLYPSIINGWHYKSMKVDGVEGKLFRSLNPSAGNQFWDITQ